MNLVEIESKITVLGNTKQAELDKANLALAPLRAQIANLENEVHRIAMTATERLGRIDGQLALLEEIKKELLPKQATPEPQASPEPPKET